MTILRALAGSLKLPNRVPQFSGRTGGMAYGGLMTSGAQSGMQAYADVGAVYGAVRRLCETIALTDWALYQQTDKAGSTDRTLVDDATAPAHHPATALWTHPNPFFTRRAFLYLHELWMETAGSCFWLICKAENDLPFARPQITSDLELWPISPTRIQPVRDPDKYIVGWVYSLGATTIPLDLAAVVPFSLPDPRDPLRALGPLQSIGVDLDAERYAGQYQRNLFVNGAEPGGVIEFDETLSDTRWAEVVTRWREQHQGVNNARRVAIIEQGKWVETGQTNRNMQYLDLRQYAQEQVMYALGMPFSMMVTRNVNLANARIGEQVYSRYTLRPRLEVIKEGLNERVLPLQGDALTMDYDLPSPPDAAFDTYQGTNLWLAGLGTQNEARQMMGMDAVDDGDRYVWEIPGGAAPAMTTTPPPQPSRLAVSPNGTQHKAAAERLGQWMPSANAAHERYQAFIQQDSVLPPMVEEAHCPQCGRWVGENIPVGSKVYCPKHQGVVIHG